MSGPTGAAGTLSVANPAKTGSGGSAVKPAGTGGTIGKGGLLNPGTGGTGSGGMGAAGMVAMGSGGSGMPAKPAPAGSKDPIIPEVTGECPEFVSGTITFMSLGGIEIVAGDKPPGPTAPMVFYWHGTGSFAGEYAGSASDVYQGVVAEGGVLVSFNGSTGGDFLSGTSVFGMGDFALTDQLLACAVRDHNVDPRRVYTTGCSAGGLFATAMAAIRSNYIAAVAPNSGGSTFPSMFQSDHTPPLMAIHGAPGVDVVFIDFSESSATAEMTWKSRGGYSMDCNHGGMHCGGGGLAGDIWRFFKDHPFGADPEPYAGGLPSGFASVCVPTP